MRFCNYGSGKNGLDGARLRPLSVIDDGRDGGFYARPLLSGTFYGLFRENSAPCGINTEIRDPGLLRSSDREGRCDFARCGRTGFCDALAYP